MVNMLNGQLVRQQDTRGYHKLLCYCMQTLALSTQTPYLFDGFSACLWSAMLLALGARLGYAGAYPI